MRVIVIGSGIAGLSAAIGLQKVGIEVTVYERTPELREVGAGISLWANAIRALDHLGVGVAVRSAALSLDQSEFRADEGRRLQARFSGKSLEQKIGVSPFIAMIHRADLVGALAGFLPVWPAMASIASEWNSMATGSQSVSPTATPTRRTP